MRLFIGADHGGFQLKEWLKPKLQKKGYDVIDCGNTSYDETDDFPEFAAAVSRSVARSSGDYGIICCRSGAGVTIAANKIHGIRAALAVTGDDVVFNRKHDDINVLTLAGDHTSFDDAMQFVEKFIETPCANEERHQRRIQQIHLLEKTQ